MAKVLSSETEFSKVCDDDRSFKTWIQPFLLWLTWWRGDIILSRWKTSTFLFSISISSAWSPGTSPSSTTGRKHTGRGEVQKNSIQHAVDLRTLYNLLPALVLCLLGCSTLWRQSLHSLHRWVHLDTCVPQLVFESLHLLFSPPWDPGQCSTNTKKNVWPKSSAVRPSSQESAMMTEASKHESSQSVVHSRSHSH